MGNIVSNAAPFGQSPTLQGGSGTPPTPPPQDLPNTPITNLNPNVIESVGQSGFGADPFGNLPKTEGGELPSLPMEPPTSTGPNLPSITPEPPPPPKPEGPFTQPLDQTDDSRQPDVIALFNQMPDIYQMMKDLEKSGCLLPELQIKSTQHVDTSPLAALQPQRLKNQTFFSSPSDEPQKPVLPDVRLTATGKDKHPAQLAELPMFLLVSLVSIVQAIQGMAQVAHFVLITYPTYEQMVISTQLTTTEVNATMIKAVVVLVLAVIGLIMGLVVLFKRTPNGSLLLYVGVGLVVINFLSQNVLVRNIFVSGNPLILPDVLSQVISKIQTAK